MVYVDLAELSDDAALRKLLIRKTFSACNFERSDHLGESTTDLADSVRNLVEEQTGQRPSGPIRLLTQLRIFGFYFSPLNLYYCFDANGKEVEFIVAEVNNTPWREQHCYVLWSGNQGEAAGQLSFRHAKQMHVSPFMQMEVDYLWHLTEPSETVAASIANLEDDRKIFDASMSLKRHALSRPRLRWILARYPWITAKIMIAIYWQAIRLWWKRCPTYQHPAKRPQPQPLVKSMKPNA